MHGEMVSCVQQQWDGVENGGKSAAKKKNKLKEKAGRDYKYLEYKFVFLIESIRSKVYLRSILLNVF